MEFTWLHLSVNHSPVFLEMTGTVMLLVSLMIKSRSLRWFALVTYCVAALAAIASFYSGEFAEDQVKNLEGFSMYLIQEHEGWAKYALWSSIFIGALCLVALFFEWKKKHELRWLTMLVVLFSLGAMFLFYLTGKTGGIIRHDEIRTAEEQQQSLLPAEDED